MESGTSLPWSNRLRREAGAFTNEQRFFDSFVEGAQLRNRAERAHVSFLRHARDAVTTTWNPLWDECFAIGPFLGRRRRYTTIPVILVARMRRQYWHLLALSKALAPVHLSTGILPDIHLLSSHLREELDAAENRDWQKTQRAAIQLGPR